MPYLFFRLKWIAIITTFSMISYTVLDNISIFDPCKAVIIESLPAPDGRMAVIVFEMECGATAPFNTQASLAPIGRVFSPKKYPAFLILEGKHTLDVRWTAQSSVEVSIPDQVSFFKKEQKTGNVSIAYK